MYTIQLTSEELTGLIQVLGQLPTSTGAFNLYAKLSLETQKPENNGTDKQSDSTAPVSEMQTLPS